jgi:Suppressor of fused protein (SUFU)
MNWPFGKTKTPDGTSVIRHSKIKTRMGTAPERTGFIEAREAAYGRLYEQPVSVSHEVFPLIPHIDVYQYRPKMKDRPICRLVTGGMSDLPMTMPRGADDAPRRVELLFYCDEPRDEYIATLRWLAHFPHSANTWVGYRHTVPNGDPPAPFWGSDMLDTFLFMPPILRKDATLSQELTLDGDGVHFLWVVPLTTAECHFKLKRGFEALMDVFDQKKHPLVFDPGRKSYV